MKDALKKIGCFAILCLYALGAIGGLGWTLYSKAWVISAGVIAVTIMAFPKAKEHFKGLTE